MGGVLEAGPSQLLDHVLFRGGQVESAIGWAARALREHDSGLAERVLAADDQIDALELEADRACISVLTLKLPEARDLRSVITANKITPVLGRIADHACNIAHVALALNQESQLKIEGRDGGQRATGEHFGRRLAAGRQVADAIHWQTKTADGARWAVTTEQVALRARRNTLDDELRHSACACPKGFDPGVSHNSA